MSPTETPPARPITMEDVQRIVGALTLELELLRRENAALRATLQQVNAAVHPVNGPPAPVAS